MRINRKKTQTSVLGVQRMLEEQLNNNDPYSQHIDAYRTPS